MESDVMIAEMDKRGYRPATIEELLALGESHPALQREFPIIALGSCWMIPHGAGSLVPGLWAIFGDRYLAVGWLESRLDYNSLRWDDNYRFLAVRK